LDCAQFVGDDFPLFHGFLGDYLTNALGSDSEFFPKLRDGFAVVPFV
jgi:hypothetical protein